MPKPGKLIAAALVLAASALGASAANAANVALSADGATFISGSSFISVTADNDTYNQAIAQANLLTTTPTPAFSYNGDTRYIFGGGENSQQNLVIKLGSSQSLTSFAATFLSFDRTPQGLSISVSNDGSNFAPLSGTLSTLEDGSEYLFTPSSPVSADYIKYSFGGPSSQYEYGGSGIYELFANDPPAVPEPAAWTMLILGFAAIGCALRGRKFRRVLT
ncbi:MAG: PEPxxWA-CTERM sorting domain-containing protein, partial [Caulobacteraceae bacterium]